MLSGYLLKMAKKKEINNAVPPLNYKSSKMFNNTIQNELYFDRFTLIVDCF